MNITASSFQLNILVTWEGINTVLVFTTMNLIRTADIYCPGEPFTSEAAVFGKWRKVRHTHQHQDGWRVQKEGQVRFYHLHGTVCILISL